MNRRDEFWSSYGAWGYSPSRWAAALLVLFHAVMAFCALGHWTSYWFAALFMNRAISMITDRYYELWREEQMRCPHVHTPHLPTTRIYKSEMMRRFSEEYSAAGGVSALQMFLQCVDRGWFEEAAFVQKAFLSALTLELETDEETD